MLLMRSFFKKKALQVESRLLTQRDYTDVQAQVGHHGLGILKLKLYPFSFTLKNVLILRHVFILHPHSTVIFVYFGPFNPKLSGRLHYRFVNTINFRNNAYNILTLE